ncbi:MAG TPA: ATP-binding protein [bacterium]|nr:ATP-binding protein [bacterium]
MGNTKKKKILVIGDTFIDENWLMSKFDLYHSYNVGREHYISNLQGPDSMIISLCGVAGIIRILNGPDPNVENDKDPISKEMRDFQSNYDLIGASVWNPMDDDLLPCILCTKHNEHKKLTPYILSGLRKPEIVDSKRQCPYDGNTCTSRTEFINLIDKNNEEAKRKISTNRLIRVYEGFGSDQPQLKYRYDWRLDVPQPLKDMSSFKMKLKEVKNLEAIIVVDHGYEVIDDIIVKYLLKKYPNTRWYVRSKMQSAQWLKTLCAKKRVQLIFTDEQLIAYRYGVRKWYHSPCVLGRASLEILGDMLGLTKYEHCTEKDVGGIHAENAAVLFDNDTAIAGSYFYEPKNNKNNAHLTNLHRAPGEKQSIHVGRSSVFFSSLIFWDLKDKLNGRNLSFACDWALNNEYQWTKACTEAWIKESPDQLSGPFDKAIIKIPETSQDRRKKINTLPSYVDSWDDWNKSSQEQAIVQTPTGPQIQLWRAHGILKDYICPGGKKRSDINNLLSRLYRYGDIAKPKHPFNCLLLAEPGWGKSFLARSIADHFDFDFLSFSVAQMASNQDLMDCLKVIVSAQNRSKKKKLIFIDEIDAQVEKHHVMGLLLGPVWDGTFKTEGNMFKIEPSIWVFASTKSENKLKEESKGRDFLSRINGPIINLDFFAQNREMMDQARTEKERQTLMKESFQDNANTPLRTELVYHGVNLLNKMFGPISWIDEDVLKIFYDTIPIDGIRSLEIFVSRFDNISRGRVSLENVPNKVKYPELDRHILQVNEWPKVNLENDLRKDELKNDIRVMVNPPRE